MQDNKWFNPELVTHSGTYLGVSDKHPEVHEVFRSNDGEWFYFAFPGAIKDIPTLIREMPKVPLGWCDE